MTLHELFDRVKDYRVLLVGDSIRDEYQYVTVLGKASKENLIATRAERLEMFEGGVHAAAAHVRNFCRDVARFSGSAQMVKRRFVDEVYMRKLFEVQWLEPLQPGACPDIDGFDLVIVTDFGHGCITRPLIERLTREARFLAVNAQSNAANYGFNLITKYPRADFVVIDEPEARLAVGEATAPINEVITKLGLSNIIVTHGVYGSIGYDGTAFCHAPAYTQAVLDTMGAGDAFFCITALLAAAGVPMRDLVHIGNAAGAAKVGIIGHRRSVTLEDLERVIGIRPSDQSRQARVPVRERGQRRECVPSCE